VEATDGKVPDGADQESKQYPGEFADIDVHSCERVLQCDPRLSSSTVVPSCHRHGTTRVANYGTTLRVHVCGP
jgi:hypothetical protein